MRSRGAAGTLEWHIITSEYPPQPGGVSDYTHVVASGLAEAGDAVHVWCPRGGESKGASVPAVHRELGRITPGDLRRMGRTLDRFSPPRRLLVQWVPHGYGYRSMNVHFCLWLWARAALHRDRVDIMVHEPYLDFGGGSWRQRCAALVHRVMTAVLLRAARQVWVAIPAWEAMWRPYALGRRLPFRWLPVPSTVPVIDDPGGVAQVRARYASDGRLLLGHFGADVAHTAGTLATVLSSVLDKRSDVVALLLGRDSDSLHRQLIARAPGLRSRLHATKALSAADLSIHVGACDALLQPYVDGVNSRQTTMMVALAHGIATATTTGRFTEPLWAESGAVSLAPSGHGDALTGAVVRLLDDPLERRRLGQKARMLYRARFDVARTVEALRQAG